MYPFFVSALSVEVDRLKIAVNKVANKVNAKGDTAEARLDDAERRINQAAVHGVHHGVALGLAALSTQTVEDYSTMPVGFQGGPPEDIENIDDLLEGYEDHATTLAEITDA